MTIDLTDTKRLLATFSLPSRLRHAFDYVGCLTLADALQLTPDRLHRLPKAGVATLQMFLDFLDIGLTVKELKQTRKMHLTFGELLGLATDNAAMLDLATLKLRRMSDEEIAHEAGKYVTTYKPSAYEAFCKGARIARQWQARLLAVTKKITPVMVKAACGHEYKTGILHTDDDDFREQRVSLARYVGPFRQGSFGSPEPLTSFLLARILACKEEAHDQEKQGGIICRNPTRI